MSLINVNNKFEKWYETILQIPTFPCLMLQMQCSISGPLCLIKAYVISIWITIDYSF